MRKWKIRSKMIAGLSLLAVVIALLIYSSYSQLARDKGLAAEISQLAAEIDYAHDLNELADRLLQSHSSFTPAARSDSMIESDNIIESELDQQTNSIETHRIDFSILRFKDSLNGYRRAISKHANARRVTSLLVDRGRQSAGLSEIEMKLTAAEADWSKVSSLDHAVLASDDRNGRLHVHLSDLVELTLNHFEEMHGGMKAFRDNVRSEQLAKENIFWTYTGLATFLIALLAWQFWSLIIVPFRTLFRGAQLIAEGHHHQQIVLFGDDELAQMAETVNKITEGFNESVEKVTQAKLHAEQEVRDRTREVIQNEQLASTGFLAAGVAHEINNPLGIIAWTAEAAEGSLEELDEESLKSIDEDVLAELFKSLKDVQAEAYRCKGITERLLHFSRLGDSSRDGEDLGELVKSVVSMVSKVGEYRCKKLTAHCEPNVIAHCNAQEIQQVVLNLVSNALESVGTDGNVDVHVKNENDPLSGIQYASVTVQDDGCGMDQDVMDHLFEPFFTRRQDNTGTGLGLSISYRIVSLHHGSLTPHSEGAGKGSQMVLRLPTRATDEQPTTTPAKPTSFEVQPEPLQTWKHVQKAA